MVRDAQITIRGRVIRVAGSGSKADIARALLDAKYTISEISKAVPMSYSQVHSIAKASGYLQVVRREAATGKIVAKTVKREPAPTPWGDPKAGRKQSTKPQKAPPLRKGMGKLRTPGLPSDIVAGECANCGHDLVVRPLPTGYALVHVNTTTEEYLATIQFCTPVPRSLIP